MNLAHPDPAQNFVQTYTVTKVDHRTNQRTVLGSGICPPNNQGNATPYYNQGDNGENPAKPGVSKEADLDRYTKEPSQNSTVVMSHSRVSATTGFMPTFNRFLISSTFAIPAMTTRGDSTSI